MCAELGKMMHHYGKPVIVQSHYAELKTLALDVLRSAGVPFQRHVEVAVQCLASAADFSAARVRNAKSEPDSAGPVVAEATRIIDAAADAGRDLLETEAREVLKAYGIAMPNHVLMRNPGDAAAAANCGCRGNDS